MADLAGFDVIIEIHKDTIVDWVNLIPVPDPSGAGDIRLLGGPFSVELPLVVPNVASTTVYLVLDIALEPLVHQSAVRFVVTLRSGSCVLLGRTLDHIGGYLALDFPLVCQARPGKTTDRGWQIFMQTPIPQLSALQLDAATRKKFPPIPTDVMTFANALARAVAALAPAVLPFPAPIFSVVPGVDSETPLQFSSVPTVAWIDSSTLGLFGYYSSGVGGSVSAKKEGDLYQANDEFMYGLPGPEPMVASRRMALLMSAAAAHRVLLCPLIRDGVIRPLKLNQQKQELAEEIHSDQYQKIYDEQFSLHYASYLNEEWTRQNSGPFVDYYEAAKREKLERADRLAVARIQADVEAEIYRRADILMTIPYFSSTSVIAAAVPPPCGTGNVHAFNQPVDEFSVQSKSIIGVLRKFDLVLDEGRLLAHYEADAFIEDVFGDVTPKVEGEIEITLDVDYWGAILAHVNVLEPRPSVETSGFTDVLVNIIKAIAPSSWAAMLTFAGILLQIELQKLIDEKLAYNLSALGLGASPPPPARIVLNVVPKLQEEAAKAIQASTSDPTLAGALQAVVSSVRARDIQITKESFTLFALVARQANYNALRPSISLPFEKFLTASAQPSVPGTLHCPKTDWGCREVTFETERVFWDTEIRVKARYHDLDMPLTAVRWSIDIGNFTFSSIGRFSFVNPGIKWSGAPAPLQTAVLHLTGVVNHPDSPLTRVEGPAFPMGHMLENEDIQVTVSGDDNAGWSLRFRGTDGNFYVRLMLDALDGLSVPRHGEAIIKVTGDELQLGWLYTVYKSACDAKYTAYSQLKAAVAAPVLERVPIAPGEDVTHLQQAARDVYRLIEAGDPAAIQQLAIVQQRYGRDALLALPKLTRGHLAIRD